MKVTNKYMGLTILVLASVFLQAGKLLVTYLYGIDKLIPSEHFLLLNLDFVITILIISVFFLLYKKSIINLIDRFRAYPITQAKDYVFRFIAIVGIGILVVYAKESLSLILSGVNRQDAVYLLGQSSIFKVFFGKFFVYSVIFIFILNLKKITKILFFIGFTLSVISFSSRSDLAVVFFLFFIVNMLNFNLVKFIKVTKYAIFVVGLSLFITAFIQNRELESHFFGPFKPLEDYFLYGAYSYILAAKAIEVASDGEKYIFPFFGYLTEYVIVKFDSSQNVVDSQFVAKFVLFYSDIRQHAANVSYPWWAWFYGAYSLLGVLLLKPLFISLLLYLSLFFRSYCFFVFFIFWFLFSSFNKFPLISIEGYITVFSLLLIEVITRHKVKNNL